MNTPIPTVKKADLIKKAGGARNVADALGVTSQAVYSWGDEVPFLRVYQLMQAHPEWVIVNQRSKRVMRRKAK
jgi:hypothetical protein